MILNINNPVNQVPSDKMLYQGKTKSDQLYDQFVLKEVQNFSGTGSNSNFMADLEAKLPTNEKFKIYDKVNDFDRNNTFLTNASFSIRNADTSLLLADRFSDDNTHFAIAKNPIKLFSFFDDMAPEVDYRHTNDLYYGLRLQGKTPQDIALNNAIGDNNPTSRGIRQLGGEPTLEEEQAAAFAESFVAENSSAKSSPIKSNPSSALKPSPEKESPEKNIIDPSPSKQLFKRSPEKEVIEIQPPKRSGKESWNLFAQKVKESKQFQDIQQNVRERGSEHRHFVNEVAKIGRRSIKQRDKENESMGQEDQNMTNIRKKVNEGYTYVDKDEGKYKNNTFIRKKGANASEEDKSYFKFLRDKRSKELEANETAVQANKDKVVKFSQKETGQKDTAQKQVIPPQPPQKETTKEAAKETLKFANYEEVTTNLELFFKTFRSEFTYIADPENKAQMTISNGSEKVGPDMAKFMRDKLNVSIQSNSNKYKANIEINKIEDALKVMKSSPRIGKRNSVGKSITDNELHFEQKTPASSKSSDATRAKSLSSDERRLIKPGGTNFKKTQEI